MADVRISDLPAATTPVAGTEVLPIVQGGITKQVSIANLTANRTVAAATINVDANSATNAVRITQTGAGNALLVEDDTSSDATPFVITSTGAVGIGTASPLVNFHAQADTSLGLINYTAGGGTSYLFRRSAGTLAAPTVVANNDTIAVIAYQGYDGASYLTASQIVGVVDGAPGPSGTNSMPGRLVFSTRTDGSASVSERMRVSSVGFVTVTGSFGRGAPVTKTGNFTLATTENWVICNGSGTITVTFPAASSWTGREVMIKTIAAQTVISASSNVVPIDGTAAGTAILAATAGKWATLVSNGTNWVIMQAN